MAAFDAQGRPRPPLAAGELESLRGFLEFQRATFAWKTSRLDRDGLNATTAASSLTLGGLLKHLAGVEDYWFSQRLHGHSATGQWDVWSAKDDAPDDLRASWRDAVKRSNVRIDEALAEGGLDVVAKRPGANGTAPTLRWILLHMIEEYARHNGHADLLREAVDGEVGT